MAVSAYCSTITMPETAKPYPSILDFLCTRFPRIHRSQWQQRILEGKVLDDNGASITPATMFTPLKRIHYFREVDNEPVIPFTEQILFQTDELLVACKPHFLPVTPVGPYVAECLLNRLRKTTGNDELVPIHRIDRETAGIVMFSMNPRTRGLYGNLFMQGRVEKSYQALAGCDGATQGAEWNIENRIVGGEPWFRMTVGAGEANARSIIRLEEIQGTTGRFSLRPLTGKTHQLRLHMGGLGYGILNDRYYPNLQPERPDNFDFPLQLIAKSVKFVDPVSGEGMEFTSKRELSWPIVPSAGGSV